METHCDVHLRRQQRSALRTPGYTHDPLDRVATAIDPNGRITQYSYDGNDNLTSVMDQIGRTTDYSYDEL